MSKILVTVVALSALTFTAHAASADDHPPEPKSPGTAVALSVGGTALSIGLTAAGAGSGNLPLFGAGLLSSMLTPAAGELYATGSPFTWGTGIRALSAVTVIAGVGEAIKCIGDRGTCQANPQLADALLITGALGYASGILYDIATAGTAADEYNQRFHLHVAPTVVRTPSSGPAVGVGIGGSF